MSPSRIALIVCYLGANVVANLFVGKWGQPALVFTALALIPFDLASRDVLHDQWSGHGLKLKMFLLIATGSIITFAVNASALRVAIASTVAFATAAAVDTAVYQLLHDKSKLVRMNASNTLSAIVDSIVFPLVAFGGLSLTLSGTQAVLKILGGLVWAAVLVRIIR